MLQFPEVEALLRDLEASHIVGRRGYGPRRLLAVILTKLFFVQPAVTTTLTLIAGNPDLLNLCACTSAQDLPSPDAVYRFLRKLRHHPWLEQLTHDVQTAIKALEPAYGEIAAVDSTDLPAFGNGQRYVRQNGPKRKRFADPDASWGHRGAVSTRTGGGHYGYKTHGAVCVKTELPISVITRPASESELPQVEHLLDLGAIRGLLPKTLILDRGYDVGPIYDGCHRRRIRLVCPLKPKDKGRDGHRVPTCQHGRREYRWKYVGTDINRGTHGASKWKCPVGLCRPGSKWISLDRFHTSIPRDTSRSHATYDQRTAVERLWARLKREWGYLDLRVRGQDRVAQHVDLIILAQLMFGLAKLRAP